MKTKPPLSRAQVAYLEDVRRHLRDVPWSRRQDLVSDLRCRLEDLTWDHFPNEILGESAEYARLAREAAGYGPSPARRFAYVRAWRRRTKILVVMSIVTVLILASATVAVVRYQPLRTENLFTWSASPEIESTLPTQVTYWPYEPGAPVVVGTGLHNVGRTTVTVTGVSVPNNDGPFLPTELRFTRDVQEMTVWQRQTPAQRISVHPGETVFISVLMKIANIPLGAGSGEWEALPTLQVEVLGIGHRLPIEGQPIGVMQQ